MNGAKVQRRTQEQRTADTRAALFEAAVVMIDRHGYAGANNASIAAWTGLMSAASSGSLREATNISRTAIPEGRESTSQEMRGQSETRDPICRSRCNSR